MRIQQRVGVRTIDKARLQWIWGLAVVLLAYIALQWVFWIGYRGYIDDVMSIRGALRWIEQWPYVGETHWELRHPYILALAVSFRTFGLSEVSAMIPGVLANMGTLVVLWTVVARSSGGRSATLTTFALTLTPIFVFCGSTIFPDAIELFFVVAAIAAFVVATEEQNLPRPIWLMLAGLLVGICFVTRETSVAVFLALLLLLVLRVGKRWSVALVFAVTCLLPILADSAFVTWNTGDPLYRYRIDIAQHHPWAQQRYFGFSAAEFQPGLDDQDALWAEGSEGSPVVVAQLEDVTPDPHRSRTIGPFDVDPWLQPYSGLLFNHEYGATVWLALGITLSLLTARRMRQSVPYAIWVFSVVGIVWFVSQAYLIGLRPHPRYFLPTVVAASCLVGYTTSWLFRRGRAVLASGIISLLVVGGLLGFDLQSERLTTERRLLDVVLKERELVYTTEETAWTARFLLRVNGVDDLVRVGAPVGPGRVLVEVEDPANPCRRLVRAGVAQSKNCAVLQVWVARRRVAGWLLERLGVLNELPDSLRTKLDRPIPTVALLSLD